MCIMYKVKNVCCLYDVCVWLFIILILHIDSMWCFGFRMKLCTVQCVHLCSLLFGFHLIYVCYCCCCLRERVFAIAIANEIIKLSSKTERIKMLINLLLLYIQFVSQWHSKFLIRFRLDLIRFVLPCLITS